MSDSINVLPSSSPQAVPVATKPLGGKRYQEIVLAVDDNGVARPVDDADGLPVKGPLTDAELRAEAVEVSAASLPLPNGAATEATLAGLSGKIPAPVAGRVPVDASGTTVPVSGPLTDAELRAEAVEVSAASLPLPAGAASESTLAALNAKVPPVGQAAMAASQPVVVASNQTPIPTVEAATILTGAAAQTAAVNNILENPAGAAGTPTDNLRSASVQVVSTGTGGTFIFEQSNDSTNWAPLPVYNAALLTGVPIVAAITATASAIIYSFPIRARFIRLRIATPITGGSIQAISRLSTEPYAPAVATVAQPTAANLNATVVGQGASGTAVSGIAVHVAGIDAGSTKRTLLTDTAGRIATASVRAEQSLTIANGASATTGETDLATGVPFAIQTPAAWTAAPISFQVSRDAGTSFQDLFDENGVEVVIPSASIPTNAARRFALNPRLFLGCDRVRVRSDTSAAPVNQLAARVVILMSRPLA